MQSVIKQGCGTGLYIKLHIQSSHQHVQAYLLYGCAGESILMSLGLVVFENINYLFIIYDIILTAFLIFLSTCLYNYIKRKNTQKEPTYHY